MRVVIAGAGGHARSVLEALRSTGEHEAVALTDADAGRAGAELDGVPVAGDDDQLEALRHRGVEGACLGVGGTASNALRRELFERLRALGFSLPVVRHGSAVLARTAEVGAGSQVLAAAVLGAGVTLGEDVIINTGAIVEHDCRIGDHVHLATGCALAGGVTVQRAAHVGIGACVLQGVTIGEGAVVGAGAVVLRDVEAGDTVVGCPAMSLKPSG